MFKQGQTIVANSQCRAGYPSSALTQGKTYTVIRPHADGDFVYIKNDDGEEEGYFNYRFDAQATPLSPSLLSPQCQIVLKHLMAAGSITQREALMDHSVQSLTRRVTDLVRAGYDIAKESKTHPITGQRYMRYVLAA